MGSSPSRQYVFPMAVPEEESGYPPPESPRERKKSVFKEADCVTMDTRAKQAPQSVTNSYVSVVNYVTEGACNDVQKVRAIYSWLAAQPIYSMTFSTVKDARSPEGFMKTIQQGSASYTAFFALLCRAANIPTVIISGVGKAGVYEVGDQDVSTLTSSWAAVHVDGSWRFVHVFWALVGVQQPRNGNRPTNKNSLPGKTVNKQDDFWFLTDPDHFIYFCRPHNSAWQLLEYPWSEAKFVNVPYFSTHYFNSGFVLNSPHAAILKSERGICEIAFRHSEYMDAELDYTLQYDEEKSKERLPQSLQLEKYVTRFGTKMEKSLRVRFPARGVYKVKVIGSGVYRSLLASFRLVCDEVMEDVQPYPLSPKIGFGYSRAAQVVGLSSSSQVRGTIVVQTGDTVKFRFSCKTKLEIESRLEAIDRSAEDLSPYVVHSHDGDDFAVTVNVPKSVEKPEYVLQVNAREVGSASPFENVVNYLLTHSTEEMTDEVSKTYETDICVLKPEAEPEAEDGLVRELIAAKDSGDRERLEKALRNCCQNGALTDDNKHVSNARRVLISLYERDLQRAMAEEQEDPVHLDSVIETAENSMVAADLEGTLDKAKSASFVKRSRRRSHKNLDLRQRTVSEIHRYSRPRPLVHTVMKATFLLLGEEKQHLEEWGDVQTLLRQQGYNSVLRRIKLTTPTLVSNVDDAERQLKACNKGSVLQTSAGAGTFYDWSYNIIKEKKTLEKEQTS